LRLALAALFVTALSINPALADITGPAIVTDGDSLKIDGQRIRIHGIDAPEAKQLCQHDGEPWQCGKSATQALKLWIGDRQVSCEELDRDRYKRIVAKCLVDGQDLGEWMVFNGWAVAYLRYSYEYTRAEHFANTDKRGIWASEFEMPWSWRKAQRQ
jgi:endonuclease YncB( thermonuclease family)